MRLPMARGKCLRHMLTLSLALICLTIWVTITPLNFLTQEMFKMFICWVIQPQALRIVYTYPVAIMSNLKSQIKYLPGTTPIFQKGCLSFPARSIIKASKIKLTTEMERYFWEMRTLSRNYFLAQEEPTDGKHSLRRSRANSPAG